MSHFKAKMHQIRFLGSVRWSFCLFVCLFVHDGVWHVEVTGQFAHRSLSIVRNFSKEDVVRKLELPFKVNFERKLYRVTWTWLIVLTCTALAIALRCVLLRLQTEWRMKCCCVALIFFPILSTRCDLVDCLLRLTAILFWQPLKQGRGQ